MDWSKETSNDFVLLVHLFPALVCSWENLEVPEFIISQWSELWNIYTISFKPQVFSLDLSKKTTSWLLPWGWIFGHWHITSKHLLLLNLNGVEYGGGPSIDVGDGVVSGPHYNRWVCSGTRNGPCSCRRAELFILEVLFQQIWTLAGNSEGNLILLDSVLKRRPVLELVKRHFWLKLLSGRCLVKNSWGHFTVLNMSGRNLLSQLVELLNWDRGVDFELFGGLLFEIIVKAHL